MPDLVIQFPRNDDAFRTALETQFGDRAVFGQVKSFDGIECFQTIVTIVLPLAPFIVDFFVRYLRESEKRIILTPEGEISLVNYSVEDAKKLLPRLAAGSLKD